MFPSAARDLQELATPMGTVEVPGGSRWTAGVLLVQTHMMARDMVPAAMVVVPTTAL